VASSNLSIIGIAHRAGKTLIGTAACETGIRKGKVRLLLVQENLSQSSIRKFKSLCDKNKVDVLVVSGYDVLGLAVGRAEIMVLGITDEGFSDKIRSILIGG
jgi:ribosomal protein L7Ae-like RNA K-turn-binding protein